MSIQRVTTTRTADLRALPERLREVVTPDIVVDDADLLEGYRHDSAALCESKRPVAAVLPRTEADVVAIVQACSDLGVSIVPQGALTGLSGAANCVGQSVALNTRRLSRVLDIDAANRIAVVEPGVTNKQLREAAAAHGLTYRPDPSSWESSTIGGNIATNAGGLCCVKYGVTSRFVRGLRVVLANGRVASIGRRTAKGVAGLNLVDLFVGSEGTLGIITQATVALEPASPDPLTTVATFPTATAAAHAVARIRGAGITPSMCELLDRTTIRAVENHAGMDIGSEVEALLIIQSDLGDTARAELERVAEHCAASGAADLVTADDLAESEQLVAARRLVYPALESMGHPLVDDVCVPLDRLAEMVGTIQTIAARSDLTIAVVGHAGDGNLHPTVVMDPADPAGLARAEAAVEEIAEAALGLGGTVTGEHGIGLLKRGLLEKELDEVALSLHHEIKELFDPGHLFNPGKVLAASFAGAE